MLEEASLGLGRETCQACRCPMGPGVGDRALRGICLWTMGALR